MATLVEHCYQVLHITGSRATAIEKAYQASCEGICKHLYADQYCIAGRKAADAAILDWFKDQGIDWNSYLIVHGSAPDTEGMKPSEADVEFYYDYWMED